MRLQPRLRQDAVHAGLAHTRFGGQLANRPVGAAVIRLVLHLPAHLSLHRRRRRPWPAAFMLSLQAVHAKLFESLFPTRNRWCGRVQTLLDRTIRHAVGQRQNQSRSKGIPRWETP
jgi:hypothetical protein